MDRFTIDKLGIAPKSDAELHSALSAFELKWRHKAEQSQALGRISRF